MGWGLAQSQKTRRRICQRGFQFLKLRDWQFYIQEIVSLEAHPPSSPKPSTPARVDLRRWWHPLQQELQVTGRHLGISLGPDSPGPAWGSVCTGFLEGSFVLNGSAVAFWSLRTQRLLLTFLPLYKLSISSVRMCSYRTFQWLPLSHAWDVVRNSAVPFGAHGKEKNYRKSPLSTLSLICPSHHQAEWGHLI